MSTTSPSNAQPSTTQPTGGKKASSKTQSDWLAPAILTARTITAAAECAPFPYIKGVSGTVVILLETVQKVKKNREDLKELCESTTEIVMILHDQILAHGNTAVKFKAMCEELESYLAAVVFAVQNLHNPSKGFRKRVKEFLLAAVDTNSKVNEMHAIMTAPSFVVTPPSQSINNCPPPSRIFQGRQIILAKMHKFFTPNSGKQLIYVLHGLGGAGKTQIALKFIQESSARFLDIFLLDASTLDTINTGLKNIAVSKFVGDSAEDTLTWLQSKHGGWLLFFDNADDPKINLNKFFPQCNHGNIIITSRNPGLRAYGTHSLVSDMEDKDAITLLLQSAAKEGSEENVQAAAVIVKVRELRVIQQFLIVEQELFHLPLAIVQAGSFILQSEDIAGYLTLYQENRARLLSEKAVQSHDHYAWTVYTTWQISFDRLRPIAATLLQLCSFLHYSGISEDMFSNASKYSFPVWLPAKEELQEPLQFLSSFLDPTGEWSSLRFSEVTNEIKSYSLITFDAATKMFSIHPLVHAWSRNTLVDEAASRLCISSLLGMSIAEIPDHDITLASLRLMPHLGALSPFNAGRGAGFGAAFLYIYLSVRKLQEAQDLIEQVFDKYNLIFGEQHPATLEIMQRLGHTYSCLGEYKKAKELEVTVLEKRSKLLGEDHLDTLRAREHLARTHSDLGDFENAKELQVTVLEKSIRLLGRDHPEALMSMGRLAWIHSKLGDFENAKELRVTVLEKRTALLGQDHPDTLTAMGNLARSHSELGDSEKAKELEVVVLEKRTKLLGEDHPDTLLAMGNLAITHSELGDLEKAKELEVVVLEKRIKLLGAHHPQTLMAMGNLASIHSKLGDFEKAKEFEVTVLEKRIKLLGEDHPDTLLAMGNLARTHSELGEFEKAKEVEVTVLEKRIKLLGEDHPATLLAMGNLARTHSKLRDFEKAKEVEVTVLENRIKLLGEDHPQTLMAMRNLASTHSELGDFEKAKKLKVTGLKKWIALLGQDHPDTLIAMGDLATTHSKLGDFEKAKELEVAVLEKRTKLLGEDHPDTLLTMGNLATTHSELGDFEKAKELEVAVLEKRIKLLGEDHPQTLMAMGNLAITHSTLGDFEKAKELEVTVLEKRRQLWGDQHPDTVGAMQNLAIMYRVLDKLTEAEELEQLVKQIQMSL
ncbi:hypothetical protein C8F04DRAFT_1196059 [Mycena alexandri]|uniref:DUF7779 domain-containing protein n=1 Tax=Mycena alexandri TaxID=1745969 RepID=A0AAD6WU14_9AGAR|nr:hypothetical protein C8F04DRAFT_1196059 [Mycena alexandri]